METLSKESYIEINGRRIGEGYPVYIIAELSANHRGSYDEAVELVEAAKEAGADAVKLQTYTPDTMTIDIDSDLFRHRDGLWVGRTLYELYSEACMPWEWQPKLKKLADGLDIDLFSSPFDETAVDFLEKMSVPAYKIASFELVDIPLIEYAAAKGKPMILSTGMATMEEIEEAVAVAKKAGASQVALLKCTSAYPAPPDEMNLGAIPYLQERFRLPVGLSDHTAGIEMPVSAIALGACIIEKHFTISRANPSPDSAFSLEPAEFKEMVAAIRAVKKKPSLEMGCQITLSKSESESRNFRRSLFAVADIRVGDEFTRQNIRSIRPSCGLHPRHLKELFGRKAAKDIRRGTPLDWSMMR